MHFRVNPSCPCIWGIFPSFSWGTLKHFAAFIFLPCFPPFWDGDSIFLSPPPRRPIRCRPHIPHLFPLRISCHSHICRLLAATQIPFTSEIPKCKNSKLHDFHDQLTARKTVSILDYCWKNKTKGWVIIVPSFCCLWHSLSKFRNSLHLSEITFNHREIVPYFRESCKIFILTKNLKTCNHFNQMK